jgi:hypothetical protein
MGDFFAGLAFDSAGTLYAVTGSGALASNPEALHTVNSDTGASTFLLSVSGAGAGQAIAFNPDNGYLYHAAGLCPSLYEKIDLSSLVRTPLAPFASCDEPTALTYAGNNEFFISTWGPGLAKVSSSGGVYRAILGSGVYKGLVWGYSSSPKQQTSTHGKVLAGPVPVKKGEPLRFFFESKPTKLDVKLFNARGQVVSELQEISNFNITLETTNFSPGIYYLIGNIETINEDEKIRQKIIITP